MPDNTKCFYHEERNSTRALNIPCAPTGKLWVCEECFNADPASDLRRALFEKYMAGHQSNIEAQMVRERIKKGLRN